MSLQSRIQPALEMPVRLRAPAWLHSQTLWAAIILAGLLALFYRDVVFMGRTFLMGPLVPGVTSDGPYGYEAAQTADIIIGDGGAIGWAMEPWSFYINQLFQRGELPLWNPHQGIGTPLLGSVQPAPFDPLLLIVHLAPQSLWPVAVDLHLLLRYFLAGFFSYLFLRSTGVGFAGGLAAGSAYMLCGYLMFYGNISYVRADTLLPLLLFAFDRLALKPARRTLVFSIGALWLLIVTGFPETLPLHVGLASLWYCVRVGLLAWAERWRVKTIVGRVVWLALSGISALLLAAFVLAPFVETVTHAEHIHYHDSPDPEMTYRGDFVTSLLSLLLPVERSIRRIPNLFPLGIVPLVLAFFAVIHSLFRRKRTLPEMATLVFFFTGAALILIAFRGPLLDWIPDLPGISSIIMWKYPQALIAFCLAYAVGAGVDFWQSDTRRLTALLAAIALLMTFLFLLLGTRLDGAIAFESMAPYGTVALLVAALALLSAAPPRWPRLRRSAVWVVVALLIIEPMLWFGHLQRPERYFAYEEPPYLEVLRASGDPFRVIGLDRELYPNTATVYGLDDIRYLDALHPQEYLDFARRFIISPNVRRRFTGIEPVIQFSRGMNFLNVEYVIADSRNNSLSQYLAGIEFEENYATTPLVINGGTGRALEIGDANPVSLRVRVPPSQRSVIDVAFGIDPSVTDCGCGLENGATFNVSVVTANGPVTLMERFVDPVHNPNDRSWLTERIELTQWAGRTVPLTLRVSAPTPGDDLSLARWVRPSLLSGGYSFPWLDDAAAETLQRSLLRQMPLPLVSLTLEGEARLAARQAPPAEAAVTLSLPDGTSSLGFGIALDPLLWSDTQAGLPTGDGVTFRIALDDGRRETMLFEQTINPQNVPEQRRWLDATVDLSPWAGQRVELRFSTDGGQPGDTTQGRAFWADVKLSGALDEPGTTLIADETQFTTVYDDGEVTVYRNELVYPRAFVVRNVEVVESTEAALDRFGEPDFNPTNTVLLTEPLPEGLADRLAGLPTHLLADTVDVVEQRTNSLRLEAHLNAPGVMVVSELDYPGWHAWVDGQEQPILEANGVARAVYLEAGTHSIVFSYVSRPFQIGIALSLGTLALLVVGLGVWGRRRPAQRPEAVAAEPDRV